MKITKAYSRDRKRKKRNYTLHVDNISTIPVTDLQKTKSKNLNKARKRKDIDTLGIDFEDSL